MNSLLIIDNNVPLAGMLNVLFKKEGINVQVANSGQEALTKLTSFTPDIILLEIGLQDMNGFMISAKIKELPSLKTTQIMFMSTSTSTSDKIKCFNLGGIDYIQKPFNNEEIKAKIKTQLKSLEDSENIKNEISSKNEQIAKYKNALMYSLGRLSQIRDDDSGKHIEKIQNFVKLISEELRKNPSYAPQLTSEFINKLRQSCTFHDIGKIAMPDNILLKTDELSSTEYDIMKQHVSFGATIIEDIIKFSGDKELLELGKQIVKHHHEKWDGTGYPDRLSSSHIPLAARITAVANTYDFLRSTKAYKAAMSHEDACKTMLAHKGTSLDPHIVEAFLKIEKQISEIFNQIESSMT
ncbi:MAG: response regulator [Candidatus Gastranaerophilales bacterium]|nr:response regulator [Candidatus Gastranaerophilales bacterium]